MLNFILQAMLFFLNGIFVYEHLTTKQGKISNLTKKLKNNSSNKARKFHEITLKCEQLLRFFIEFFFQDLPFFDFPIIIYFSFHYNEVFSFKSAWKYTRRRLFGLVLKKNSLKQHYPSYNEYQNLKLEFSGNLSWSWEILKITGEFSMYQNANSV